MSYDRFGRTSDMAMRDHAEGCLIVTALGLMIIDVCLCVALIAMMLSA